ncbi:MAG: UPF0182 family protein, partial [Chlorobium sp.]|nr:UPF0182 family protein [Chlorobium sp.]
GEMLWFTALGYNDRFWVYQLAVVGFGLGGALLGWFFTWILTTAILSKFFKLLIWAVGFVIGGAWGLSSWQSVLKFINMETADIADPILNMNAGFYFFILPFLDEINVFLLLISMLSLIALILATYFRVDGRGNVNLNFSGIEPANRAKLHSGILRNGVIVIFVLAFGKYLARYHLMYSVTGVVKGPGWADVNIVLPAYNIIIILMVLFGLALLIKPARNTIRKFFFKLGIKNIHSEPVLLASAGGSILIVWFLGLSIIPGAFQWLRVGPNEITFERPYIENNIKLTRYAFNLNNINEKEFPVSENFTRGMVDSNRATFGNIRLWDWRALDAVYKQFQEIRLYYEFTDVDIDRYKYAGMYNQVMVSVREMEASNLPRQSQTFVNQRFKYTHGYGITLTTVTDFTSEGLPNLLIKDIPPQSTYKELTVKQPQIYYGELTNSHVIVNTTESEFDYPSGENNVYIKYPGKGGVQISNLWRKFLFGWMFDGTQLFFSGYPTSQSRIMFHRQIEDRVKTLAPFLTFDADPYIVLANGKLYWIIDAYTTSKYFPYSATFNSTENITYKEGDATRVLTNETAPELDGVDYMRNSVKVVVDAFNGSVDFYIFDEKDPLIKVWSKIFPGMFKSKEQMPTDIRDHVRYPIDFLLVQGLMYAKYHMTDPTVFYNQEDLWIRATEQYYGQVQPVAPYYIMWQLPGTSKPEFVLILPFTPKNRQVMIGWIAGMCDSDNYGKFIAYKFPKDKRVVGPQQVETKIDQDSFLSGQLSLWDQRGSNVIRGNVLAIPIENTIIYVEPIYLQAETAAYPELRLVAVMHDDNLSYAPTFAEALNKLFSETGAETAAETLTVEKNEGVRTQQPQVSISDQIKNANDAFNNYLKLQGEKRFEEAAKELQKLQRILQELSEKKL